MARAAAGLRALRRLLDALYLAGGVIAAGFLLAILGLIVAQMVARWTGHVVPGASDYAGYCMAAASFFAFAHALDRGAHIRVGLLLTALGRHRRWAEIWAMAVGAVTATFFARYAVKGTYWSWKLGDVSQGLDRTPLWVPQLSMAAGTVLLAICFWDHLIRLIATGDDGIRTEQAEDRPAGPR
ncbi:TRAP transporter small permease [Rhodovulum kholense]|uniref:TRAP transporter small permease protein n=1 Tax=Rhodovulum kholense TaxID=453584 RepID=A0A8E2VMQ7_9RHOB|nr:TRAP transporter small permease [Rhodovulum kholense]PTW51463.1 TRAP-type C4-dicarboxylate transport system permease small subunit [Rhodovulum kholense]